MKGFFITGTDTEIGKTQITLGLMLSIQRLGLRVTGMKPVASGCGSTPEGLRNSDAELIAGLSSEPQAYRHINPYAFKPAIAPHLAAREAGIRIEFDVIRRAFAQLAKGVDYCLVEGVGGWRAPLNETKTLADLAVHLRLPVILVVGIRLGCINHTLLSVESIIGMVPFAGWIACILSSDDAYADANVTALAERIEAPLLAVVPFLQVPTSDGFAHYLTPAALRLTGS
jgi:dethiobiotin synthetase